MTKKLFFLIITVFAMLLLSACTANEANEIIGAISDSISSGFPATDSSTTVTDAPNADTDTTPATTASEETTPPEDYIETCRSLIISSEYSKAIDCYSKNISGNYTMESAAADVILELCKKLNTDVLAGTTDKKSADIQLTVIDKVVESVSLTIHGYSDAKEAVSDSLASKSAFIAGTDLQKLGNYTDALKEFSKVIETDSNYAAATAAINDCIGKLKTAAFTKAESLATSKNFSEAISCLKDLLKVLPNDEEVNGKISTYTLTHIRTALSDAEAAFITVDDYKKALEHINSALQFYPENEELLAKKDYYNKFAPQKLSSHNVFDEYNFKINSIGKDLLGNTHTDVMETKSVWTDDKGYIIYVINGNYNKLTFTVYGLDPGYDYLCGISVRDYSKGDYELSTYIYNNENIKCGALPFQVELDITGIQMIRLWCNTGVAIADATVQRTVK